MQSFGTLADPVRRRIVELLAGGERSAGEVGAAVQAEFGISQPAVSLHLRVLRESGLVTVRPSGARRLYALDSGPIRVVDRWLDQFVRPETTRPEAPDLAEQSSGSRDQGKKHKKRSKRKDRHR
jgi:DNA-binding transcriptional ArsR family regulator